MIKRYVREGSGKTGPKMRIGRAVMALTISLFASFFASDVVHSQTITFAGDADQGEGGRWMRSKVEQFSKALSYSKNKDAAAKLIKYMVSYETQKEHAIKLSRLPTRPAVYEDKDVLTAQPWFSRLQVA
jgi:ABC-type glycerol-3-phosphate transport system substrate-binding protein